MSILSRKGRCERASIDEVYLDLTEAAKERMAHVPTNRDDLHAEAQKSHILGVTVSVSPRMVWLYSSKPSHLGTKFSVDDAARYMNDMKMFLF